MRTRRLLVALVLPMALASACGSEEPTTAKDPAAPTSSGPSATPAKTGEPQCSEVWQSEARLPGGYQGCYERSRLVKPSGRYCEFGKPLFTYADRFYAVRAGTIKEAHKPFAHDAGYQDTLAKCSG